MSSDNTHLINLPLISIMIRSMARPALNNALASVASQTYSNIEVIIINAKGNKHTTINNYQKYFKIQLINENGPPLNRSNAANLAIKNAKGDYLIFLDDDDTFDPSHIQNLITCALEKNLKIIYTGVRVLDTTDKLVRNLDEPFSHNKLWRENFIPIHAVLFSKDCLSTGIAFDEKLPVYEDWDFWLALAQHYNFVHLPGISATYYQYGTSGLINQNKAFVIAARKAIYAKWRDKIPPEIISEEFALAERTQTLELTVQGLETERAKMQQEYVNQEIAYQHIENELAYLKEIYKQLENHYRENERLYRQLDIEQRNLETEHQKLQTEHQKLQTEHHEFQTIYQKLETEHHNLINNYNDLETIYRQLETAYKQLEHAYLNDKSRKILAPLRNIWHKIQPYQWRNSVYVTLRSAYRRLPLSYRQHLRHTLQNQGWWQKIWMILNSDLPPDVMSQPEAEKTPFNKETVRAQAETDFDSWLRTNRRLVVPECERPEISIIIVLYQQAGLSLMALQTLLKNVKTPYELVIVDNASGERVQALLDRIDGATIFRNNANTGFVNAVNQAAAVSRGKYLLLLNNDALLLPGALEKLIRCLENNPEAGAAGGMILLWDGRLQEAASIIWNDGSCLGYGREDNPELPQYNFLRAVDYCSGAFLLIRNKIFQDCGGFDPDYAPAYYEESDFCAKLWHKGIKVLYDPTARIRHFEFASSDNMQRAVALQEEHRELFKKKNNQFLARQYTPKPENILFARMRLRDGARRILFIDDRVPFTWLGSGFPRASDIINELALKLEHFVTHYPLQFSVPEDNPRLALPAQVEVMTGYGLANLEKFLRERQHYYDDIFISRPHNMAAIQHIRKNFPELFKGMRIIYDAEALACRREVLQAKYTGKKVSTQESDKLLAEEIALASDADIVIAVSEEEASHFKKAGLETSVIGHRVPWRGGDATFEQRKDIIFVGALHADDTPNSDSLRWFVSDIWPKITKTIVDVNLHIIGTCKANSIKALSSDSIKVHGRVDDLKTFYDNARLFIIPTRFAAGIPYKAHEAASYGVPMVTTPLIAKQLGWETFLPNSLDEAEFAQLCINLYTNKTAWEYQRNLLKQKVEEELAILGIDRIMPDKKNKTS